MEGHSDSDKCIKDTKYEITNLELFVAPFELAVIEH